MKMKTIWLSWLYLFALCAVLGFVPAPTGLVKALLILVSIGFFVPGFMLLIQADNRGQKKTVRTVRNLALGSLGATLLLIILNFCSVMMSKLWGTILYGVLVVVSSPMVCGQYWVIGLFGWACLLMTALMLLRKK